MYWTTYCESCTDHTKYYEDEVDESIFRYYGISLLSEGEEQIITNGKKSGKMSTFDVKSKGQLIGVKVGFIGNKLNGLDFAYLPKLVSIVKH